MTQTVVGLLLIVAGGIVLASGDHDPVLQFYACAEGVVGLFWLALGAWSLRRADRRLRDDVARGFPVLPPGPKE